MDEREMAGMESMPAMEAEMPAETAMGGAMAEPMAEASEAESAEERM